ncbi:UBN2_2 domain-containing protein [Cephalotus follicularis]|uniref:UBN2_2 domain-containing protein n=1 Tax=Cephalotus follicularis TaxID=3775 RepID=A0A1Q3BC39_CEPFO|nr:UBN2_2 domain-containing protein [Cephalotus follicularis]
MWNYVVICKHINTNDCDTTLSSYFISVYVSGVEPLNGTNFLTWKEQIGIVLGVMDLDHALRLDTPAAIMAQSTIEQRAAYEKWERSNRMSLMIMKSSISVAIQGAIPDSNDAKTYLASVEEQFKGSSKAHASILIMKMLTTMYDGTSGIREHIMKMNDMTSKLKGMEMAISEGFLVHFIMTSLLVQFGPFKINYNTQKEKWKMSELISMCVQEEESLKVERPDFAHLATAGPTRKKLKGNDKGKKKADLEKSINKASASDTKHVQAPKCHFCRKVGHLRKDCTGFKDWLAKKGNDFNFMIYESLLVDIPSNTWWVDTGCTVHITNSLQGFLTVRKLLKGSGTLRLLMEWRMQLKL